MLVRLQKYLAEAGVSSRRQCERVILDGRVKVNGKVVAVLGSKVDPESDSVFVDGRKVQGKEKLYLALNKPPKFLCSRRAEDGKRTIYDLIPPTMGNLFSVGRLDYESEGLLLMTNDGDFSLQVSHPRYNIIKEYRAVVSGQAPEDTAKRLMAGFYSEGERLKAASARVVLQKKTHTIFVLQLGEGKKREIRRMFRLLDLRVMVLKRTQIGSIDLDGLGSGKWRMLRKSEIKSVLASSKSVHPRKNKR